MTNLRDVDAKRPQVLRQIAELQRLPMPELIDRWRVLIGGEVPSYNRAFILKRLTCRFQELAYGGLPMATFQEMDRALAAAGYDGLGARNSAHTAAMVARRKSGLPVTGTRLVREWNGVRYEVLVTHDGFEYDGRPYKSLTAISKAITGSHWNGPQFFGLRRKGGSDL
ncbi:MAG: DUF2924 domain-containing protein [bacterium]